MVFRAWVSFYCGAYDIHIKSACFKGHIGMEKEKKDAARRRRSTRDQRASEPKVEAKRGSQRPDVMPVAAGNEQCVVWSKYSLHTPWRVGKQRKPVKIWRFCVHGRELVQRSVPSSRLRVEVRCGLCVVARGEVQVKRLGDSLLRFFVTEKFQGRGHSRDAFCRPTSGGYIRTSLNPATWHSRLSAWSV